MADPTRAFYRAAVHEVQKYREPTAADFDDLVQEGVLAALRATEGRDLRDPVTYGVVSLRNALRSLVAGRQPMTGSGTPGRRTHDQARQTRYRVQTPADGPEEPLGDTDTRIVVREAVRGLPARDRLICWLLFWEGLSIPQAAPMVGLTPYGLRSRWLRHVRPVLRQALQNLSPRGLCVVP